MGNAGLGFRVYGLGMLWGFIIWHEFPLLMTWTGAVLTLLSGMYILYQERKTITESDIR